jgi:5-methylcytosine-specific restriction enzyme A
MGTGWQNSERKQTLTPAFLRLRPLVLKRDGYTCTWIPSIDEPDPIDSKNYGSAVVISKNVDPMRTQMCGDRATDVDHVNGHEDSMNNLRALCSWHHDIKSSREGNDSRWNEHRMSEQHSGIVRDSNNE